MGSSGGEMKPGRELDALIAEHVMGFKPFQRKYNAGPGQFFKPAWLNKNNVEVFTGPPPRYSTEIAAAWEVFERIAGDNRLGDADVSTTNGGQDWSASFTVALKGEVRAWGETAPHAICLAALKAVGYKVKE